MDKNWSSCHDKSTQPAILIPVRQDIHVKNRKKLYVFNFHAFFFQLPTSNLVMSEIEASYVDSLKHSITFLCRHTYLQDNHILPALGKKFHNNSVLALIFSYLPILKYYHSLGCHKFDESYLRLKSINLRGVVLMPTLFKMKLLTAVFRSSCT